MKRGENINTHYGGRLPGLQSGQSSVVFQANISSSGSAEVPTIAQPDHEDVLQNISSSVTEFADNFLRAS